MTLATASRKASGWSRRRLLEATSPTTFTLGLLGAVAVVVRLGGPVGVAPGHACPAPPEEAVPDVLGPGVDARAGRRDRRVLTGVCRDGHRVEDGQRRARVEADGHPLGAQPDHDRQDVAGPG